MSGDPKTDWCDQEELAVGWAMHALEPDEEALLRSHLPECESCRRTVRNTEEVTAAIGESVAQFDPPARLKTRLMDAIEHTPQERPAPVVAKVPDRQEVAEPISLDAARRRKASRARVLLAAAAVILVAVVTGVVGQRLGNLSDQVAAQNARTDQLENTLRLAADPATNRAVLRTSSGDAMAVLLSGGASAVVVADKMPPNDASKETYVVWGTSGSGPVALTTFDVSPGSKDIRLTWDKSAYAHHGFAISLEPGRTAPATPSSVVAAGQVATV
ncbi:anti-sigma factor [Umezawaea sp. Da 62-37]|uniref:anti-sigma factor n=1 Tax=Umezawaea sp. Da 62-37 TaxID=3075927 RepID=UPI0028F6CA18|nr:anti-sigma factor [Umezawaea sp. Da 62-37]WNV89017.1 anti-sigma factor [Umezawaea sp. Da 62-37]